MSIRPGQAKGPYVGTSDTNGQWLAPVISFFDPTAAFPAAPVIGDRYIASATATHAGVTWTKDYIYEWNGVTWTETAPAAGMVIFVISLNQMYAYTVAGGWRLYSDFWFKPVISIFDNTSAIPVAPAVGDRYIAMVTAFTWVKDVIYEWDGVQWIATTPADGASVFVRDLNDFYYYDAIEWTPLEDNWLDPIIEIFDNTAALPVAPAIGDRYIALVSANGWTINHIYEWNTGAWVDTTPISGMMVYDNDTAVPYLYSGVAWGAFASLTAHAIGGPLHTSSTVTDIKTKVAGPDVLITSQASEFSSAPIIAKGAPLRADVILLEDSADTQKKKSAEIGNLVPWLYGTGAAPSTAGLVDGTLYIRYTP
jgi:hypothetical protein